MKPHDKGQVACKGEPNTLIAEVESSMEKARVYPNELFPYQIEEIDSELWKFDVVQTEKQRVEYEGGAKHDLGC